MDTYTNNDDAVNDEVSNTGQSDEGTTEHVADYPNRKKFHSSAMYAASMWHNTVKHVKPSHDGGSLPQA